MKIRQNVKERRGEDDKNKETDKSQTAAVTSQVTGVLIQQYKIK